METADETVASGGAEEVEKTEEPGGVAEQATQVNGRRVSLGISDLLRSLPDFRVGDTVRIHYRIKEGEKERVQIYEGAVIAIKGEGMGKTFTVRRVTHDVGVERIFPYHSRSIVRVEVARRGRVRRGKLYYLRKRSGKAARIREHFADAAGKSRKPEQKSDGGVKREESKKESVG